MERLLRHFATLTAIVAIYLVLGSAVHLVPRGDAGAEGAVSEWRFVNGASWLVVIKLLPVSLKLYAAALLLIVGIGVPLGVIWGGWRWSLPRAAGALVAAAVAALPAFWVASLVVGAAARDASFPVSPAFMPPLSVEGPSSERWLGTFWFALLPALLIALPATALVANTVRKAVTEHLTGPTGIALKSRGLGRARRLYRYALPASWATILRALREILPVVMGMSVLVEWVLFYPGLGRRVFEAVRDGNHEIVLAATLVMAFTVLIWRVLLEGLESWILWERNSKP